MGTFCWKKCSWRYQLCAFATILIDTVRYKLSWEDIEYNVWIGVSDCLCTHKSANLVYIFPRCEALREINSKIALECAHNSSWWQCMHNFISYMILCTINDLKKMIFTHGLCVWFTLLRASQSITQCNTRPDSCWVCTWKMISNLFDINFIYGYLHDHWLQK